MKLTAVFTLLLFLNHASCFVELKDYFHQTGVALGDTAVDLLNNAKPVGQAIIGSAEQAGTILLAQAAQELAAKLMIIYGVNSKRDIPSLIEEMKAEIEQASHFLHAQLAYLAVIFDGAISKLSQVASRIENLEFLKNPLNVVLQEINSVIESHGKFVDGVLDELKRYFSGKDGPKNSAFLESLAKVLKLNFVVKASKNQTQQSQNATQTTGKREEILKQFQHYLARRESQDRTAEAMHSWEKAQYKRDIATDILSEVEPTMAAFIQPHIKALKETIVDLANTLKLQAKKMWIQANVDLKELIAILRQHLETLKQEGKQLVTQSVEALVVLAEGMTKRDSQVSELKDYAVKMAKIAQ